MLMVTFQEFQYFSDIETTVVQCHVMWYFTFLTKSVTCFNLV